MAEYKDREHYIPLRKSELIGLLCREYGLKAEDAESFRQFAVLISAVFHFEFHQKLEELKDEYALFDPDRTTRPLREPTARERAEQLDKFLDRFTWLMERANFIHLDRATIEEAMKDFSDWGLNMAVDFSAFEKLKVFARGDTIGTRWKRPWWYFGKLRMVRVPVYDRLVVIAKLKENAQAPESVNTQAVFLKLFKDIPKMDLEMLLPGARMEMPGLQRLKIGGSLLTGLALILYQLGKYLLTVAVLGFEAIYFLSAGVLGYAYKQYYGYQSTRTACNLRLTQSLYYQNLDNNAGVFFQLLDEAEEQECREVLLAYFCLWHIAGPEGWTAAVLDDFVEADLKSRTGLKVDFEIGDALAKLQRLGLIHRQDERFVAVSIAEALEKVDGMWDAYFKYAKSAGTQPAMPQLAVSESRP